MLQASEVGQENGDGTRADFLMPAISGSGFGLSRKPDISGQDSLTPSQYDLYGNFLEFFKRMSPGSERQL